MLTAAAPIVARSRRVPRVRLEPKVGRDLAAATLVRMVRGPIHCFSADPSVGRERGTRDQGRGWRSQGIGGSRPDAIAAPPASHAASHGGHTWSHVVEQVDESRAADERRVPQNDGMDGAPRDF